MPAVEQLAALYWTPVALRVLPSQTTEIDLPAARVIILAYRRIIGNIFVLSKAQFYQTYTALKCWLNQRTCRIHKMRRIGGRRRVQIKIASCIFYMTLLIIYIQKSTFLYYAIKPAFAWLNSAAIVATCIKEMMSDIFLCNDFHKPKSFLFYISASEIFSC